MHHARPDGALAYDDIAFSVRLNSLQRCTVWLRAKSKARAAWSRSGVAKLPCWARFGQGERLTKETVKTGVACKFMQTIRDISFAEFSSVSWLKKENWSQVAFNRTGGGRSFSRPIFVSREEVYLQLRSSFRG